MPRSDKLLMDLAAFARARPGIRALLRRARGPLDGVALRFDRPPFAVTVDGHEVRGFLRHRSFLRRAAEDYERFSSDLLMEHLAPGGVLVDGGAHVGLYSLMASSRVGPTGRVLAFEPDPYNASALRVNVTRSGLKNVEVIEAAISDADGETVFHTSGSTIGSSLIQRSRVDDRTATTVRTIALDSVLEPCETLVVKLDLEGAEPQALRGARRLLTESGRARMLLEHNPEALADASTSGSELVEQLQRLGFTVSFVDEAAMRLMPLAESETPPAKGNLLADRGFYDSGSRRAA